ncbi:MAG: PAS domain-containing protein [Chitinispirillia bacterium]|nr:PAS domain-containing protein [Chitinispirillia bacterium]
MSVITRLKTAAFTLQAFFVVIAFVLMVTSSYFFVSAIERKNLRQAAETTLSLMQSKIETELRESETLMSTVSYSILEKISTGNSPEEIYTYINYIWDNVIKNDKHNLNFSGFCGLFHVFGDTLVCDNGWGAPTGYNYRERPWYKAAVAANGEIALTQPFISQRDSAHIVVHTRQIKGQDGHPLATINFAIDISYIAKYVVNISLAQDSYGILLDSNCIIIAHPDPTMLRRRMSNTQGTMALLEPDLIRDNRLYERNVTNRYNEPVVVFMQTMKNGWRIGIMTPKNTYYKDMRIMAAFLIVLGIFLAAILNYILLRITRDKRKTDAFTQVMFSTVPMACCIWNNKREPVFCNEEAIRMYGAADMRGLLDNFLVKTMPEYQPDGRLSKETAFKYLEQAFSEGNLHFEWMHKRWDGTPLPCEIKLIPTVYNNENVVLAYIQDLREQKAALQKMREADARAQIMLDATPLCANFWNRDFKNIDCNQEAVRLFELSSKKEYLEKFYDLSPEIQPDGTPSKDLALNCVRKAFDHGYFRCDWIHRKLNGELIPCEITLVRVRYKDDYIVAGYTHDLRELNSAIEKIREADERALMMLDAAPLSITIWDESRNLIDFNMESVRIIGLSNKQEYRDRFWKTVPEFQSDGERSADKFQRFFKKVFETGSAKETWNQNTATGELVPFDVSGTRIRYKDKDIAIVSSRDLREIYAANEKMREADERSLLMLDATPLGITLWDKEMNLIDFNMEAARVVGIYSKQEYREKFGSLTPELQPDGENSLQKLTNFFSRTFEEGTAQIPSWYHCHINGEPIPFDATAVRLKYKNEDVAMVCCRDIREIIAANNKFREADERAKIMLDATPVSCTLFDENYNAIDCNQEALKLLGISSRRDYLNNVYKYSPECQPDGSPSKDRGNEYIRKAIDEGYYRFEWTHISSSGDYVPVEITLVRVKLKGSHAVAGYARDLRELKAMIKEMHRAEIAEESNKAKSRFLATMSHEIRTPMNVILGVTEMQLQDDTLPPYLREAFVQVYNSGDMLLGIINDILDLSKIEAERMEFMPVKYDLASLVNDTAHLNMMRNSKPIIFELIVDERAYSHLFGDELRIKQILNNLLSNAFKFTDKGTIRLTVSVEDETYADNSENNSTLILVVSDTGQGMSEEQVTRLFTEYTRFNLEVNRTVEGTGLGMNITRRLIGMMGGKITVDSTVGKGTTVSVRLPQKRVSGERIGKELAENLRKFRVVSTTGSRAQVTREYMPYGKVLVVDDVESNLYVAKGLLSPYGLNVDMAANGFEAVDKIKAGERYDVIFMDHMMPKMDGLEAAKQIRMLGYKQPIIALTANAVVGQADLFLKSGFDDFISKPIDIRQLNAALNRFIRDRQAPETIENARKDKNIAQAALPPVPAKITVKMPTGPLIPVTPELLAIFVRDANKVLPHLQKAAPKIKGLTGDEMKLYTTNVHGMKSALANIGEMDLARMAATLEKAAKSGDMLTLEENAMNFLNKLVEITKNAEEKSKPQIAAAAADEDPALLKKQLTAVTKACKSYDEKGAGEALKKLNGKAWTAETGKALESIAEMLLHSDFEEAAATATKLLSKPKAKPEPKQKPKK